MVRKGYPKITLSLAGEGVDMPITELSEAVIVDRIP